VKTFKCFLPLISILFLLFGTGCTKKIIHTEATPYTSIEAESKPATIKPEEKPAAQTETPTPDSLSAQEQERKIKEEALREEALRRKSLKEDSLKEAAAPKEASAREEASRTVNLESIYFDFDQAVVRQDQKEIMTKNAQWLKTNPQARIKIEGNCDERGTAEYNLALGQRRADVTKDFLEGLGIASKRMQTISYGFERPLVRGVDETTWAKNRRVDFVLIR
jgi:peptidoglycan-associated lipoprotein